jgi:signal transduction histidine kinase
MDRIQNEIPGKILIVDDNLKNIELAVSLLQDENYEIAIANSGKDALAILEEFKPDLTLLDVMMPEMDGYEVCQRIKSNPNTSETPVIFLTAKTEPDDIVKGFRLGGIDYIKKPFNQDELLMRVRSHINLKKSRELIIKQNDEKTALLSITAHDLKNPLQAIWGLLDILELKIDKLDKSDILEILYDIKLSTKTAIHITKDLLDLHKYESGKFNFMLVDFDPNEVVDLNVEQNRRIAEEKAIKIIYENSNSDFKINADKSKFERVVDNLISNAIKFSNPGADVWVKISVNGDKLRISVKDAGPGLTDKDKENLFKKFAKLTAKPTGGESSSGLGLSIVKLLTEGMNGQVFCKSEYGSGAEFFVEFPKLKS